MKTKSRPHLDPDCHCKPCVAWDNRTHNMCQCGHERARHMTGSPSTVCMDPACPCMKFRN